MIVDVSVVIRLVLQEAGFEPTLALLTRDDLACPDLMDLEAAQALSTKKRRGQLGAEQTKLALSRVSALPTRREPSSPLAALALELSLRLHAAFYDSLYLALAIGRDDVLVTGDRRFFNAARTAPDLRRHLSLL